MTNVLLFVLLLLQPAPALPPPEAWTAAERAIVRLKPAAFPGLSTPVREYLDQRGCTIPQSPDVEDTPHNVIRGRFTSSKQTDVAVLCSVRGTSVILVFRGGSASNVAELAPAEDKGFLQTIGDNKIGFSRAIFPAAPSDIRALHKEFGVGQLPRIDHDGIHNAFVGKASTILYWDGKKWLELAGMD